jgi:hypothetical protein
MSTTLGGYDPPTAAQPTRLRVALHRATIRCLATALTVMGIGPALLAMSSAPAAANGYVDLNEESWARSDAAGNVYRLTARIAIETDGAGSGRFRFRLQCFKTDAATDQTKANTCKFHFATGSNAYWCNSQVPDQTTTPPAVCAGRHLDDGTGSDVLWVGTVWRSVAHQVELASVRGFSATFNAGAGPAGVAHWIATENAIVNLANQQAENAYAEWSSNCNYYSPPRPGAVCAAWCAMFATWVWDIAGVPAIDSSVRETYAARELGLYGRDVWGTWHRTAPKPGDWVIWGEPSTSIGGHNDIVVNVRSDGSLDVVGGNVSGKVTKRHVFPGSTTTNGQPLSGYVSPPG